MKTLILASLFLVQSNVSLAQTDTRLTTVAPTPTNPWTASLKTELGSTVESAKVAGGGGTDTQFRLSYKITDAAQIGILVGGKYPIATENQVQADQRMIASDIALAGVYVAPGLLEADKTEVDGRIYLPTSDAAEASKENFVLRADLKLPYTLAPQRVATITVSPRYADYQVNPSRLEMVSQAKIAQGKAIVPYAAFNHRVSLLDTAGMNRKEEYVGPEVGVEVNPHRMIKLSLSLAQERNILNPTSRNVRGDYALFDTNETKYLLGAQIKL